MSRLRILFLSPFPPGPATFGAQRRILGILGPMSRRHHVTVVAMVPGATDQEPVAASIREAGAEAVLVPCREAAGASKRLLQLRSTASRHSFERLFFTLPAFQDSIDGLLARDRFDVVNVQFPFLSHYALRTSAPGVAPPRLVLDQHNVEHDLVRQMTGLQRGVARHLYTSLNWRKVRREEIGAWRRFDGVTFTSATDEGRARALVPTIRSQVVPNAVDVEFFRPRAGDPPRDPPTVLFFGTFAYYPNLDGVLHFLRNAWPIIAASHPTARLKIIGASPPPEVLAFSGPRVEFMGLVPDVRPHLADATVSIVPLRIGGGTRLKVLEAMAMARPIVSTRLGAEGIDATPGRDIVLADEPDAFASAVCRVLGDRALAASLGAAARSLVELRYSWDAVGLVLEDFFRQLLEGPRPS